MVNMLWTSVEYILVDFDLIKLYDGNAIIK